jgi:hypothetical protein
MLRPAMVAVAEPSAEALAQAPSDEVPEQAPHDAE